MNNEIMSFKCKESSLNNLHKNQDDISEVFFDSKDEEKIETTKKSIDLDTRNNFKEKLAHFEELSQFLLARNKQSNVKAKFELSEQLESRYFDKATSVTDFVPRIQKRRFTFINDPRNENFFKKIAGFSEKLNF